MELEQLQQALSMGGDSATIFLAYFLWKLERRLHNLELFTGLKKISGQNAC
jgi:hypothetical protein